MLPNVANDLFRRVFWTFVQAFTGAILIAPLLDIDALGAAAIAGISAVLVVVKNFASVQLSENGID